MDRESTETEDLGKGLVLIVSGEDDVPKDVNTPSGCSKEIELKQEHSKRLKPGSTTNVLTQDVDYSDCRRTEDDQKPHHNNTFQRRKVSASFTAALNSENLSSKEVSAGDNSNKNTVRCS